MYLREHDTLAQIAAGFGISGRHRPRLHQRGHRPARRTRAGPAQDAARADPDFVLLDGTLAECDRVGDGRADYSHKHRRHGVNVQVVTDPDGRLLWISPALPGRTHDLTAARTHRIIRICERQGIPVLADRAYQGAGPWVTTGLKRPPGRNSPPPRRPVNRALAAARAPVERGVGTPEVLADLPQVPVQPQSHDVNRQSRPHPGEATLKKLSSTGQTAIGTASR